MKTKIQDIQDKIFRKLNAETKIKNKPVVLVIIDGFGVSPDKIGSPWEKAKHPNFSEIEKWYPFTALQASGIAVGLPWGKEGNSEVGHLTIGAGKIIYNYLPKISRAIEDGSFFQNEAFLKATKKPILHLLGLFSSGTVHAYSEHLYALLDLAKQKNVPRVCLHLFSDGKDAYLKEGAVFFKKLEKEIKEKYPNTIIASVIGRKFAMDRDENWDRTEKAYSLFVKSGGGVFQKASTYIEQQYQKEIFDTSIEPAYLENSNSRIKEGDAVIFYNFREDSTRQLTRAFLEEKFDKFEREQLNNLVFVTMTEYDKKLPALIAFKSAGIDYPLARIISDSGLTQLHTAESEKYAHITYFLNGGREESFANEDRILIPSPRVSSYDQIPEMSAHKIKEAIILNLKNYNFIAANFANADMVGHTGDFDATVKALETLDECVGEMIPKILEMDGVLLITADHGNAEEKLYKMTGQKRTMHSVNPVPFYFINKDFKRKKERSEKEIDKEYKDVKGALMDISPTILELLGLEKPAEMTGQSLINKLFF